MNGIDAAGGIRSIAQFLHQGGASQTVGPSAPFQSTPSKGLSIQNDEGQTLYDIRDELKAAITGALTNGDGTDVRAEVQNAVQSTLEEHGFDLGEVRLAMEQRTGGSMPFRSMASFEPGSFTSGDSEGQDLVDKFLAQFRSGMNLDLEG